MKRNVSRGGWSVVLVLALAGASFAQIKFKPKTLIKNGLPYIEMQDGRLQPLIPWNILSDKVLLSMAERATARDFTNRVNAAVGVPPEAFTLAADQTGIRDQSQRGTCWIFATIAGMEASYRREYGRTLDLSEQFLNHAVKSKSLDYPKKYKYENQSSYWGGGNSHSGVRGAMNYFTTEERFALYLSDVAMDALRRSIPEAGTLAWQDAPAANLVTQAEVDAFEYSPKYIKPEARRQAIYGITSAVFLEAAQTQDTDQMEKYIASRHEIVLDIVTKWKWSGDNSMLIYDESAQGGGHVVLAVGYDRKKGYFLIKNSWNDGALLKVSYEFIRKASSGGAIITGVRRPDSQPDRRAYWIGRWGMDHDGWRGTLIIRRLPDRFSPDGTRLGSYYGADGSVHTVNGKVLEDGQGLELWIDFGKVETAPESRQGQPFETYVNSSEPRYAAGTTTWSGTPFGVFLVRDGSNFGKPAQGPFTEKKWIGSWNMNHHGETALLEIRNLVKTVFAAGTVYQIQAVYTDKSGKTWPIEGMMAAKTLHVADLKVTLAPGSVQPFKLIFHTRDEQLASGTTISDRTKFGVYAVKQLKSAR
jgi:hypothetical protein